jgi:uncharacterized membrane protein
MPRTMLAGYVPWVRSGSNEEGTMPIIQQSVVVDVPLDLARTSWDAFIYRKLIGHYSVGDRQVEWKPADDAEDAATIWFEDVDGDRTRVVLRVDYDPALMKCGDPNPDNCVEDSLLADLTRYKRFTEDTALGDRAAADLDV